MVQELSIKDVLKKHGYQVSLGVFVDHTAIASFPIRMEKPFSEGFIRRYSIINNGVLVSIDDGEPGLVKAPKYACRLIIIADIMKACVEINYDPSLVFLYNTTPDVEVEKDEFREMLYPLSKRNKSLEETLEDLLEQGLNEGFDDVLENAAKELNVLRGFNVVKEIFE